MSDQLLNDFDSNVRAKALRKEIEAGGFGTPGNYLNLHAHTFYSFNYRGYSPSSFAVEAKRAGLDHLINNRALSRCTQSFHHDQYGNSQFPALSLQISQFFTLLFNFPKNGFFWFAWFLVGQGIHFNGAKFFIQ